MRIGVLSDTHGDLVSARKALTNMGRIDLLLHAGDHYRDANQLAESREIVICAVVGNCDWDISEPEDLLINAGGKRIWLTHGHKYNIKGSYHRLIKKAKEHKIDIVVFGHTHVATCETVEGVLLFNPGSTTIPRGGQGPSYGIIEIVNHEIIPDIFQL